MAVVVVIMLKLVCQAVQVAAEVLTIAQVVEPVTKEVIVQLRDITAEMVLIAALIILVVGEVAQVDQRQRTPLWPDRVMAARMCRRK